jgi:polyisoprenoid-binding protein YceI
MFTKVRGRFCGVDGYVDIAPDPNECRVEVAIDMASVESGDTARDAHLRSADLFDVERYPASTFTGTTRGWTGSSGILDGVLTIKDLPRPVQLQVTYLGAVTDPWGGQRAIFSAATTVNREDWGITWNMPLASGGLLVSKEIQLEIELETVRDD